MYPQPDDLITRGLHLSTASLQIGPTKYHHKLKATTQHLKYHAVTHLPHCSPRSLVSTLAATAKLDARVNSVCYLFSNVMMNKFQVQTNAWGSDSGTGSQCAQIDGLEGDLIAWNSIFSRVNNANNIKSYANAYSSAGIPRKPLSQCFSIPTNWGRRYELSPILS